jgi:hypothetical protein
VTRRGRFSVVPKKFRHDADSDWILMLLVRELFSFWCEVPH